MIRIENTRWKAVLVNWDAVLAKINAWNGRIQRYNIMYQWLFQFNADWRDYHSCYVALPFSASIHVRIDW